MTHWELRHKLNTQEWQQTKVLVGASQVILIYLNKQFEGVITDKRERRETGEAEALLHYCCESVNYKLLFFCRQTLVFYCAIELFAGMEVLGNELKEINGVWFV